MKLDITDINKAFSPTHEIHEPKKFIGRYEEIESCITALATEGSFIAIFGLRGIGKSSVANQVKLIAEGNNELPKILQLQYLLPRKNFDYMVHLVRCDEFVTDIKGLIKRILYGDDQNPSIFSHNKNGDKRTIAFKEKNKIQGGLNVPIAKIGGELEEETSYENILTDDLIQEFRQALSVTQKDNQNKTGLLILIDEFDIINDKNGFASLVKTCSSKFVKFGVVGIGDSIEDLIEDHSSIGRQINSILVKPMPTKELIQIIKSAEESIKKEIKFESAVVDEIVNESEGFPYFVHLLGKESLIQAFKRQEKIIDLELYHEVKNKLISGEFSLTQEFRYVQACRTSPERELLLKLFAESSDNIILTEEIYEQAKGFGIEKPSIYMDELRDTKNIAPILIISRDGRHVRFSDPILKIYAKKRNSIHNKY